MSQNIPQEIAGAPAADLNFRPGYDLKKEVEAFMSENKQPAPATEESARRTISPDLSFVQPSPSDLAATEALINDQDPDITDEEKTVFLKALLNDQLVHLPISLFGGQIRVEIRSRYNYEHKLIFDLLREDMETGQLPKGDVDLFVNRMQCYFMGLMIERVNGEIFSALITPSARDSDMKATAAALRALVEAKCNMPAIRWTALLNAMRLFESKCAKLSTMAVNEDFWKPRG